VLKHFVGVAVAGQLQVAVGVAGVHGLSRGLELHNGVVAEMRSMKPSRFIPRFSPVAGFSRGTAKATSLPRICFWGWLK